MIDTSASADQPFKSASGQFTLIYNGEIYNYLDLKAANSSINWRTHSDTETLIELLARNPIERVLQSCRGQFAFALLDSHEASLTLARDRFGEKPLYYFCEEGYLIYSSELKPIVDTMQQLGIATRVDVEAVQDYLQLGYFPAPESLVAGVRKVLPGTYEKFQLNASGWAKVVSKNWAPHWRAQTSRPNPTENDLEKVLGQAVEEQLIADVPVGTFLSGGVDSSLITAFAARSRPSNLHTFSIGFHDEALDESRFALAAASRLGTDHHAYEMTDRDAEAEYEHLQVAFSEPLGDPSQLPTQYLARRAREHVTVALSGDGGDEFFFGYPRYERFLQLNRFRSHSGKTLDQALVRSLRIASRGASTLRATKLQSKFERISSALSSDDPSVTYMASVGFEHMLPPLREGKSHESVFASRFGWNRNPLELLREIDVETYLPDDILVKVDRAAMSVSLETRAPFLDVRVANLAATLSPDQLFGGQELKSLLKALARKFLPTEIIDRPKMGFGPPIDRWMRTSFREQVLSDVQGTNWEAMHINSEIIQGNFQGFMDGKQSGGAFYWSLFQLSAAIRRLHLQCE